jgi:Arc/MetJ family transcription regulator
MTTIELDDKLINRVIKMGHYQNAQKAIDAILSDYVQTHRKQTTPRRLFFVNTFFNFSNANSTYK